ncbi:MAG: DNA mismatch repair protein MutS [Bacteroidetes bacterium]|nr:DNA mismatch repair protein MutS [Bacteroidota bacterium]MBU1485946.1 DNA mismatch repair protein MutS [Bacteroidota bacterium]MBU2046220.1 DNA mismatch repair protein MutS [Bacteroidota bacterium]MBU2267888.1 DNA mismatch repair protein MutS [Bacteroidota bacterium]MBU2377089.1 DNA mismatch repair protein MutS [Bacteroidota bacterium]
MNINQNILANYTSKIELLNGDSKDLKKRIDQYSYLRLGVFFLAIFLTYLFFDVGFAAIIPIFILMIVAFLFLVKVQLKKKNLFDFKNQQIILLENEVNNILHFKNIYDDGSQFTDAKHPYTDDLDIFGPYSIFALINRCATAKGNLILASWLKKASNKREIEQRQQSIKELAQHQNQSLDFRTRLFSLPAHQTEKIITFFQKDAVEDTMFLKKPMVNILIWLTPIVNFSLLIAAILLGGIFWKLLALALVLTGIGSIFFKKDVDKIHVELSRCDDLLSNYANNLKWIDEHAWKTELIQEMVLPIKGKKSMSQQIHGLSKILQQLDARLNIMVSIVLNLFLQWDLRCIIKFAKWQNENGNHFLSGFELVSQFEAMISLSTLDVHYPEWCYPKINPDFSLKSTNLGHPLIEESKRINNDFSFGNNVTVDVITGSNMAGKSTFLRTLGVNMVLAFAGAKVCASHFETSIFNLISYMRIKDSLADQTSTFKAEIDRLKMILDFSANDPNSLVLIDEMLRGTNSRDKYLGSKVFIQKLIQQKTAGLVATHDLQIAELEKEFPEQLRNFHFDIQVENEEMFFDYKMKDGECKTFNASILLKAIGIDTGN